MTFATVDRLSGWPAQPVVEPFMQLSPGVIQQTHHFERAIVGAGIAAGNSGGQLSAYTTRQRRRVFLAYAQVMEMDEHDAI